MFGWVWERLSFANVTAVVALVFAMSGGAYAAGRLASGGSGGSGVASAAAHHGARGSRKKKRRYVITSTRQVSPKVLKALRGRAGKEGAAGAAGAQGPAGPVGPGGAQGIQGEKGETGPKGETGAKGEAGANGEPWTAGGTVPSGKSLRGEWSVTGVAAGAGVNFINSVSYALPLSSAPTTHFIRPEEEPLPSGCTGSVEEPGAEPGNLCVFAKEEANSKQLAGGVYPLPFICKWETGCVPNVSGEGEGSVYGFGIVASSEEEGEVTLNGTWAVTEE